MKKNITLLLIVSLLGIQTTCYAACTFRDTFSPKTGVQVFDIIPRYEHSDIIATHNSTSFTVEDENCVRDSKNTYFDRQRKKQDFQVKIGFDDKVNYCIIHVVYEMSSISSVDWSTCYGNISYSTFDSDSPRIPMSNIIYHNYFIYFFKQES